MKITESHNYDGLMLADKVESDLCRKIKVMLDSGQYLLPQQQELADSYNVSLRTIRTVVNRLKDRKVIRSVKGRGMFALPEKESISGNILLVGNDFSHPYTSLVTSMAGEHLLAIGLTPVMVRGKDIAAAVKDKDVRGLLVIQDSPEIDAFLEYTHLPYCGINDALTGDLRQSIWRQTVRGNSYLAGYIATEILLSKNKRNIIIFGGGFSQAHIEGYRDALRHNGITPEPDSCFILDFASKSEEEIRQLCSETREVIQRKVDIHEDMGFIDTTGSLVHGQGAVFNWMIEGVFDRERVVAISAEPEKNHMATTKVFVDTKPLIKRAVDIILGHSKPFSTCETHDNIYIQEQTGQISRKYSIKEYFYMTRQKTVG
jgi:hypothetical protein